MVQYFKTFNHIAVDTMVTLRSLGEGGATDVKMVRQTANSVGVERVVGAWGDRVWPVRGDRTLNSSFQLCFTMT